jgi:hypothetical protein
VKVSERIAEGFHRAAGAVRSLLNTAHSKKEMIDLRREKLEKLTGGKDIKPAAENDCTPPAEEDSTRPAENDSTLPTEKVDQEEA